MENREVKKLVEKGLQEHTPRLYLSSVDDRRSGLGGEGPGPVGISWRLVVGVRPVVKKVVYVHLEVPELVVEVFSLFFGVGSHFFFVGKFQSFR